MKQTFEITVKHRERVEVPATATRGRCYDWQSLPDTRELVEIEIDLPALAAEYGPAAVKNKSGRSTLAGGLIKFSNVSKLRRMK